MRLRDCGFMGETQSYKQKKVQSPYKRPGRPARIAKVQETLSARGPLFGRLEPSPSRPEQSPEYYQTTPKPETPNTHSQSTNLFGAKKLSVPLRTARSGLGGPVHQVKAPNRELNRNRSPTSPATNQQLQT